VSPAGEPPSAFRRRVGEVWHEVQQLHRFSLAVSSGEGWPGPPPVPAASFRCHVGGRAAPMAVLVGDELPEQCVPCRRHVRPAMHRQVGRRNNQQGVRKRRRAQMLTRGRCRWDGSARTYPERFGRRRLTEVEVSQPHIPCFRSGESPQSSAAGHLPFQGICPPVPPVGHFLCNRVSPPMRTINKMFPKTRQGSCSAPYTPNI
jgi:hypothetical protein